MHEQVVRGHYLIDMAIIEGFDHGLRGTIQRSLCSNNEEGHQRTADSK